MAIFVAKITDKLFTITYETLYIMLFTGIFTRDLKPYIPITTRLIRTI